MNFKSCDYTGPGDGGQCAAAPAHPDHLGAVRLVDVREPHELTAELGPIAGIELVPLGTLPGPLDAAARDTPIVFVGRSGNRSGRAALAAGALGFGRVASMRGGMIAWNERGFAATR